MCIDFIIISYLINYVLVYSALYIKRSKLNLLSDAILRKFINDAKKNFVNFYISNIYNVSLAHIP